MTLAELISISTDIHSQTYNHWSMFIGIHLALLGGLFAFDLDIKTGFKLGFLLFYFIVAGINLGASLNLMNQYHAIFYDIQALESLSPGHLESYLLNHNLSYDKPVLVLAHIITGVMVFVGLFLPSKKQH